MLHLMSETVDLNGMDVTTCELSLLSINKMEMKKSIISRAQTSYQSSQCNGRIS